MNCIDIGEVILMQNFHISSIEVLQALVVPAAGIKTLFMRKDMDTLILLVSVSEKSCKGFQRVINPPSCEVTAAVLRIPTDEAVLSLGKHHCNVDVVIALPGKHGLVSEQRIKRLSHN